jgi:excisionase family DNA binding protein
MKTTLSSARAAAAGQATAPTPSWLTLAEAADRLGVAKSALYSWLQAGRVPHHRFGRLIKIHSDDLARFVASGRAEGTWEPYGGRSTQ